MLRAQLGEGSRRFEKAWRITVAINSFVYLPSYQSLNCTPPTSCTYHLVLIPDEASIFTPSFTPLRPLEQSLNLSPKRTSNTSPLEKSCSHRFITHQPGNLFSTNMAADRPYEPTLIGIPKELRLNIFRKLFVDECLQYGRDTHSI